MCMCITDCLLIIANKMAEHTSIESAKEFESCYTTTSMGATSNTFEKIGNQMDQSLRTRVRVPTYAIL